MRASETATDLIKHFEAVAFVAYPDPKTGGEPFTIGYGHTRGVKPGDKCTQEQADAWLEEDLGDAEQAVDRAVTVSLAQHEFDALVSFVYNLGGRRLEESTLLKRLNAGDTFAAGQEFLKWVSPGSSVERGLRRRRIAERALFFGGDWRKALQAHIAAGG